MRFKLVVFLFLICNKSFAVTAASCSQNDIQVAINTAGDGGTVTLPTGTADYTSRTISTTSFSAATATINFASSHGLTSDFVGQGRVVIAGVLDGNYNGTFLVTAIPSSTSLQYSLAAANATSSGGTMKPLVGFVGQGMTIQGTSPPVNSTQGASASACTINEKLAVADNGQAFDFSIPAGKTFRLSNVKFVGGFVDRSAGGTPSTGFFRIYGGTTSGRFDHISTSGWSGNETTLFAFLDNFTGVIDHWSWSGGFMIGLNINHSDFKAIASDAFGDHSWDSAPSFGSSSCTYFEYSTITNTNTVAAQAFIDSTGGGGRICVRDITSTGYFFAVHGTESSGRSRGGRLMEFYKNTITCGESGACDAMIVNRSGPVILWNNTVIAGAASQWNEAVKPWLFRSADSFTGWGGCDGTSAYDVNDNGGTSGVFDSSLAPFSKGTACVSPPAANCNGGSSSTTDSLGLNSAPWSASQWAPTGANAGKPYSLRNCGSGGGCGSPNWASEITGNNTNSIQTLGAQFAAHTWSNGDNWEIRRATSCIDSPGGGQTATTFTYGTNPATPAASARNAQEADYEFNNDYSQANFAFGTYTPVSAHQIANRDYYAQGVLADPLSTGTAVGTFSQRPLSCTSAVGFWATDRSELYICTGFNNNVIALPVTTTVAATIVQPATNVLPAVTVGAVSGDAWTRYYVPYTDPHPLDQ